MSEDIRQFLQSVESIDTSEHEGVYVEVNGEVTHEFIS